MCRYGAGRLTFKITGLANINASNADGLAVCFQLRQPCPTLPQFCYKGKCNVAVMNPANDCCPAAALPIP